MRRVEHVWRMAENRNAYRLLVGKSEGKRALALALVLSIAYLKVFLMACLPIHGLRIFLFLFIYKFIIYDCFVCTL
jgi:hypothetical protein